MNMSQAEEMIRKLDLPEAAEQLRKLYGSGEETIRFQRERYARLIRSYEEQFGAKDGIRLISAPGRTEIGGNHTDHNRGRVLAAAKDIRQSRWTLPTWRSIRTRREPLRP